MPACFHAHGSATLLKVDECSLVLQGHLTWIYSYSRWRLGNVFPLLQFNVKRCGKKDMSSSNNSLTLNTKKLAMTSFKFGPCNLRKYILNLMCCTPQRCWLQDTENTHNTMRNTCPDRRPLFTSLGFPELHKVACTALLSPLVIGGDRTLREALSL